MFNIDGTQCWRNDKGQLHRLDGPAIIHPPDGTARYYQNGQLHRIGGPAVIYANGSVEYWQNGQLHRIDGPAVEYADGGEEWWYLNGRLHREDGPAVEYADGGEEWYQNGQLHREDGPAAIYDGRCEYWVDGEIPLTICDLIITNRPMVFQGELDAEVIYDSEDVEYKAYRFTDPDELALAILYYS